MIGKDEASTIEYIKKARSICHSEMPKVDEECSSVASCVNSMTNEEMLIRVYGNNVNNKPHNPSKLDNGYYSDTSVSSPKRLLPANASVNNTMRLPLYSSGEYIQSEATPYFEETVAMKQGNQDLQINSVNNSDSVPMLANEGEYSAESIAVDENTTTIDALSKDMGYVDYNTAISQSSTEQTVQLSHDPGSVKMIHKLLADTKSFPYVVLHEDSIAPINDQLGENDAEESISDYSPYLQNVNDCSRASSSSQEMDSVYTDHYNFAIQHNRADMKMTIAKQTPLHKTNSVSSIDFGYIKASSNDGYVPEQ